ncbi:M23 family metallopeptidase [Paenibacillus abyssi]|uniref:M23ase beta-sheet core domain-containing protein n=1 Tax=Paenibacillus abyssi TaxID=1340531 RepID=A0A917CJK6_9BACL|nr:M23 family metallopeptidase [Paenibacillus abyssi]GGF88702.1 hypothetical protein GCM10010916_02500 [Paenibacillus abyssi]
MGTTAPTMKFRVSSEYGVLEEIRGGRVHRGVDIAMPRGTELHSIADGTVERVVNYGGERLGRGIFVRTDSGDLHVYGHLDKVSVETGDHVDAGALIGLSGNTGHSSGPHLHFALMHDGQYADPTHLVDRLQHFSGDIDGPGIFGIKGPAVWIAERAAGSAKEHVKSSVQEHVYQFLSDAGAVLLDLSYGVGLVGCALLIVLGAVGLRSGYRWSAVTFVSYALIRLLLGGAAR